MTTQAWMAGGRRLLFLGAGVLLGLLSLRLPAPAGPQAPGFSAVRAKADIDILARGPHTAWDQPSLLPVRAHLRARLEGLGLQVTSLRYPPFTDHFGHTYPLENLVASLPGRSGSSLLLVSHYDSSPKKRTAEVGGSRGAADDGYGVATMLELAGLLAKEPKQENGVRFLFTDAEETGLYGARAEMERNVEAYRDVNLVINLEARGIRGPVVMFETGRGNLATLRLYREARRPFAYSFAVDVYRHMPNGTDFTAFLARNFGGLNFAVLDDLSYYHTPRDNPDNVDLGSLQHYGEQVLPVVRAYAAGARYAGRDAFVSGQDMVYFSWLPGTFFSWSAHADHLLSLALALAFLDWAWWQIRRGRAGLASSALWMGVWLLMGAACVGVGLGASFAAAKLTGIPWRFIYMPNVPLDRPVTWTLVLGTGLLAYGLARRWMAHGGSRRSPLVGAMALNLALLGVMTAMLPGGTFLFSAPLLAALVALVLAEVLGRPWLALLGTAFTVSLFVPVLHLFSLALTFGALGALLLVASFPLALAGGLAAEGD